MPSETDTSIGPQETPPETVEPADGLTDTSDALEAIESAHEADGPDTELECNDVEPAKKRRTINWARVFAFIVLPALALLLAVAAGYLKWQNGLDHRAGVARIESVAAAKDTTVALLSYKPDTVEKDLGAAEERLTGTFKDSYTQLTHDVVIPGAQQKHITAVATVPAVASVQATPDHAVVLLYVNQTTIIATDAPTDSVSIVRVTLDNVHGKWLVSEFDPI